MKETMQLWRPGKEANSVVTYKSSAARGVRRYVVRTDNPREVTGQESTRPNRPRPSRHMSLESKTSIYMT